MFKWMKKTAAATLTVAMILGTVTTALAGRGGVVDEWNNTNEFLESEKLYMTGDSEVEDPITVNVIPGQDDNTRLTLTASSRFSFEESLLTEDAEEVYKQNSVAVAESLNNHERRTVTIREDTYGFLSSFVDCIDQTYLMKKIPELDVFYNLDIQERIENKNLVELYLYQQAIVNEYAISSIDSEIKVKSVETGEGNVEEIYFYVLTKTMSEIGEQNSGSWFYAHIIYTVDGPELIKIWIQSPEFETFQNKLQSSLSSFGARAVLSDNFSEDYATLLKNEYEANKDKILTLPPIEDDSAIDGFVLDSEGDRTVQARQTIYYNRSSVASAAKKYAYSYNPLFVTMTEDCTNYVSQCMWQSPSWGFDKIGNGEAAQWSCTKNSNGKYYRDPSSWAGVIPLYTYFQLNDNPSVAGTVYGISATTSGYSYSNVQVGDVIQFHNGSRWRHTVIVSEILSGTRTTAKILCAAHTTDQDKKPLSTYLSSTPTYRVIHINNFITQY